MAPTAARQATDKFRRALFAHRRGALEEARALYSQALLEKPDDSETLLQLGVLAVQTGDAEGGIKLINQSLQITPDQAEAYSSLGNALRELKRPAEALENYAHALALDPGHAAALNNRGSALLDLGREQEALESYDESLKLRPTHSGTWYNHANTLLKMGRREEAVTSYQRAIELRPDFEAALRAHSRVLLALDRHIETVASLKRYLLLYPNDANACLEMGMVLSDLRRIPEALEILDRAIRLDPHFVPAHLHRATTLAVANRLEEAIESYRNAMQIEPGCAWAFGGAAHLRLMRCDWSDWDQTCEQLNARVAQGESAIAPLALSSFSDSAQLQQQCAVTFTRTFFPPSKPLWTGAVYSHQRTRVAYLSADFRTHPVSYLLAGVLEHHDRRRFEVTALSLQAAEDSITGKRIRESVDEFIEVSSLSDSDVAALIRKMEIDVLVDLQGYTMWNRTGILGHRPAPLQVNYLGYPGTMGASYIDYIIGDDEVIPPHTEDAYTERVVRLPNCYLPLDNQQLISPQIPTRQEAGLPSQGFVFGAFNNHYKINPPIFEVWMRLLRNCPGSVLWLRLAEAGPTRNLLREAEARGVPPSRLVFAPQLPSLADHLARLSLADLFLDTLPYNAHATAAHALWAGVPVVTCRGSSFASRVGASLLRNCGLDELIADSLQAYEALAGRLAASPSALAAVRGRLARNRAAAPLFDTEAYTRALEAAFSTMLERSRSGEAPSGFAVPRSR